MIFSGNLAPLAPLRAFENSEESIKLWKLYFDDCFTIILKLEARI